MACYRPLPAWFTPAGEGEDCGSISFSPSRGARQVDLPCGRCFGCRSSRALEWTVRCQHEAKLHDLSVFVTLTYDDEHLPPNDSVSKRDCQLFLKRLRKKHAAENFHYEVDEDGRRRKVGAKVRYFLSAEYGDTTFRPHYHALLFGIDFPDKVRVRGDGDRTEYRSPTLDKIWGLGACILGSVTIDSAAYVAGYVYKKQAGVKAYHRVEPETGECVEVEAPFSLMSRKPGIGADWFRRFSTDYFPSDEVILNGSKVKPPRYYLKLAEQDGIDLSEVRSKRIESLEENFGETFPHRLRVREEVAKAKRRAKRRSYL